MNGQMHLSSPWWTYYNELNALFEKDSEVKLQFNDEEKEIKIFVENGRKADALTKLLPAEKEFGNVKIKISVIPANAGPSDYQLFADAFYGNPVVKEIDNFDTVFGNMSYVVFQNKVVQFFNDQMDDINGNKSTLFQEIAKEVFGETKGVFFCTEAPVNLTKPLGEWP